MTNDDLAEKVAAVLDDHRISPWSDRTFGCRSCADRYERTADPFEMREYARLSHPGWTHDEAMSHLAAALLPLIREREAAAWDEGYLFGYWQDRGYGSEEARAKDVPWHLLGHLGLEPVDDPEDTWNPYRATLDGADQ